MPERFEIYVVYKRCYINTLPFLFLSYSVSQKAMHLTFDSSFGSKCKLIFKILSLTDSKETLHVTVAGSSTLPEIY